MPTLWTEYVSLHHGKSIREDKEPTARAVVSHRSDSTNALHSVLYIVVCTDAPPHIRHGKGCALGDTLRTG